MFHANLRTTARQLMPVGIGAVKCGARGLATTTPPQNFRVLGVQQIAIGGLDKAPLSHLWSDLLGVPKIGSYKAEKEVCSSERSHGSLGSSVHANTTALISNTAAAHAHPTITCS